MSQQDFGQKYSSKYILALKNKCPVSLLGRAGPTNEEKVNWNCLNFVTTSREHTWCENVGIFCKSVPKSEEEKIYFRGQ
jgi:hypothetical protein